VGASIFINRVARPGTARWAGAFCAAALSWTCPAPAAEHVSSLADFTLEQLSSIEVTSVSKRGERISDAPASIYVITNDEIRRAGMRTLAEALRLAPNLQIARRSSSTYAISARGFNNAIGNKLLVLIDGRTVYTPLFSGVFWDQQNVMLEDVERIEVISGPGATLWGANAVNGVINVITRSAKDTQGTLAAAGVGNRDHGGVARYGGRLGDAGHFRIYGMRSELQNTTRADGLSVADGWQAGQGGFRADWRSGRDGFTVQGDAYSGQSEHGGFVGAFELRPVEVHGANLLARWSRQLEGGSDIRVQTYLDKTNRDDPLFYRPQSEIFDIDFHHGIPLANQRVLWGGGYRQGRDHVEPGSVFTSFVPASSRLEWYNLFVQDEIRLAERLELTLGLRLERNDYTGWEQLPSVRLAWKPTDDRLIWGAASRAVRSPSRLDRDVRFPASPIVIPPLAPFFLLHGGTEFQSEVVNVYEVGYRAQPSASFNYSVTAFRHNWYRVRGAAPGVFAVRPTVLDNSIEGIVQGMEGWATLQAMRRWRLSAGFVALHEKLTANPGNNAELANDPDQQWALRSSHDVSDRHELDLLLRHVSALPFHGIQAYTALDARWGWRATWSTEISLTLNNLLDREHAEFGPLPGRSEYGRSVFFKVLWRI
jgi:iron complex outermembrane receptor protein